MLVADAAISELLICPYCGFSLNRMANGALHCVSPDCGSKGAPFPDAGELPILVDFTTSVLDLDSVVASGAASVLRRPSGLRAKIFALLDGVNPITPRFSRTMLDDCNELAKSQGRRARLVIVGGGTVGSGEDALYASSDVDLISFDIYASRHVTMLADAHSIPLADQSVEGVWIHSVLEHVIDPVRVVSEIERILRPGGYLFADTPFLWPVHEKAYDFTRWTPSGHRWLFRGFDVIAAGTSSGPGTLSLLSLRALATSLFRSGKIGRIVAAPLIWLRWLDRLCDDRNGLDAAAGLFFYGRKFTSPLRVKDLIAFYDEQLPLQASARRSS